MSEISGTKSENYYVKAIVVKGQKSYLLVYDNDDFLRDTLSIPKYNVFSIDVEFEKSKHGISLGLFRESESYFEISKIYELSSKLKLKELPLSTKILKCPLPLDYLTEANVGIEDYYKYGVKNKKDQEVDNQDENEKSIKKESFEGEYFVIDAIDEYGISINFKKDSIIYNESGEMGKMYNEFLLSVVKSDSNAVYLKYDKTLNGYTGNASTLSPFGIVTFDKDNITFDSEYLKQKYGSQKVFIKK